MLNELDKELTNRGHRFVRYADDMVMLCKSRRGAERVKESITHFIENKLFLKVNKEKTQVVYLSKIKFLVPYRSNSCIFWQNLTGKVLWQNL